MNVSNLKKTDFFIVEDALPPEMVENLVAVVDRLDAQYRAPIGAQDVGRTSSSVINPNRPPSKLMGPHERLNLSDFVGKDEIFLELLDWPKTFPKVWDLLGWNIQQYHSHLTVTAPSSPDEAEVQKRFGWHQDSGRLNIELEGNPRPRVSLKVGFFLTDTRTRGCANFYVVPGSHLQNELEFPADGVSNPDGMLEVRVAPGTAVFLRSAIVSCRESESLGHHEESTLLRLRLPVVETAGRHDCVPLYGSMRPN